MRNIETFSRTAVHRSRDARQTVERRSHLLYIFVKALGKCSDLVIPLGNKRNREIALTDISDTLSNCGNGIYSLADYIVYKPRQKCQQ